jgi:hypothetical protein
MDTRLKQEHARWRPTSRVKSIIYKKVLMSIILWLFGLPATLALVMWLIEIM